MESSMDYDREFSAGMKMSLMDNSKAKKKASFGGMGSIFGSSSTAKASKP